MRLTIKFGEPIDEEEKTFIEEQGQRLGGRLYRIGGEDMLVAEGSYENMLGLIFITSYLKHKELLLRQ